MMNKIRSAKVNLLRFLFILPLLAVILLSFRKQINDSITRKQSIVDQTVFTDTVPEVKTVNSKGYFIDVKGKDGECIVVVKDASRKEVFQLPLTEWNKKEPYYFDLYGEIPPPPPPAPPRAPGAPGSVVVKEFLQRNPSVKEVGWVYNIDNTAAILHLSKQDGSSERFNLNKETEKKAAEQKYGDLPLIAAIEVPTLNTTTVDAVSPVARVTGVINTTLAPTVPPAGTTNVVMAALAPTIISGHDLATTPAPNVVGASGPVSVEGFAVISDEGHAITGREDIIITISRNTTRQQLDQFVNQMKAKDIDLSYDEIEYDKGFLIKISGTMISKDGSKSRFVASDFEKLILAMIVKEERTYFKVSTRDRKEVI